MGAGCRSRLLPEVHRLMQVWGIVGCVGVLLPVRTPFNQHMAVKPSPPVGHLVTPDRPGALPVVLRRQVPTPSSYPRATTHQLCSQCAAPGPLS